jgi:long-chain acyl-CoA synthetase
MRPASVIAAHMAPGAIGTDRQPADISGRMPARHPPGQATMTRHRDTSADLGALLDEDAAARRAAAVLAGLAGLPAGERIAVVAGNGPAFVAARDAATAADLVLAPINPRLAGPEVAFIGSHARPRVVLAERVHVDLAQIAAAAAGAPVVVVDDLTSAAPLDLAPVLSRVGATLLYTSGTTGRPKGCLRTAAQEQARVAELTASYRLAADDVHLIVCPLAHSAPGIFLRAGRAAGARTVIAPRFAPEPFLDAVARWRASVVFLVPTQIQRLLAVPDRARAELSSLRAVIVAGAPLAPATKAAALAWLGPDILHEFYGSSETGTITVIGPDDHAAHPGSVGRPPPGVSLRVLDADGAPVADGEVGEIHVASPTVMAGYLDDDGSLSRPGEQDGHVSVGDLGRLDDGWLTLVDRKHDTIISGGVNVYPAEVERALADHPAVAGAVAFGVDDAEWGQIVAAVVATRPGHALVPADIRAFLREHIAGYKLPRAVALCDLDELPIGSSGRRCAGPPARASPRGSCASRSSAPGARPPALGGAACGPSPSGTASCGRTSSSRASRPVDDTVGRGSRRASHASRSLKSPRRSRETWDSRRGGAPPATTPRRGMQVISGACASTFDVAGLAAGRGCRWH